MKLLLTVDELIDHMKAKGISFSIIPETDAKKFLHENNYYMKLASYRANYPKYKTGSKQGQYIRPCLINTCQIQYLVSKI